MKPTVDASEILDYYTHSKSIKATSRKFGISECIVRKILISLGIVCTDRQNEIFSYINSGLSASQIAEKLGVRERTVKLYLPYTKGSYRTTPPSPNAMRIRKHRNKNTTGEGNQYGN